jgi:hypothetical protein
MLLIDSLIIVSVLPRGRAKEGLALFKALRLAGGNDGSSIPALYLNNSSASSRFTASRRLSTSAIGASWEETAEGMPTCPTLALSFIMESRVPQTSRQRKALMASPDRDDREPCKNEL